MKAVKKLLLVLFLAAGLRPAATPVHASFAATAAKTFSISVGSWTKTPPKFFLLRQSQTLAINEQIQTSNAVLGSDQAVQPQTFHLSQNLTSPVAYLSFWYRVHSQEVSPGLDLPALSVSLNQLPVFSIGPDTDSGWIKTWLPLYMFDNDLGKLDFVVNNTIDELNPTWVELKDITTAQVLVTTGDQLQFIDPAAESIHVGLVSSAGETFHFADTSPLTIDVDNLPSEDLELTYWTVDSQGITSSPATTQLGWYLSSLPIEIVARIIHHQPEETIVELQLPVSDIAKINFWAVDSQGNETSLEAWADLFPGQSEKRLIDLGQIPLETAQIKVAITDFGGTRAVCYNGIINLKGKL